MHNNELNLLETPYLQEFNRITTQLLKIKEALDTDNVEEAKLLLENEIYASGKFMVIQQRVKALYPDFVVILDQALQEDKTTKLMWQVGYCLKIGMTPIEISKLLPISNRTVSVYGTKLRKMNILEALNK